MWTKPDLPFQDLPALPPEGIVVETTAVLKAVITASRALAALDHACRRLPDPSMLINIVPILEAQASSEIENIVTTNDELFQAANGLLDEPSAAVKEALRYREALRAGFDSLATRPLTTQTAIAICSHIQGRPVVVRDRPGTYIATSRRQQRIYTPPEGQSLILDHLSAWERFLHADHDLDPLVSMALQHYQFEAIHPFFDGNGRTGRIINLLYLVERGLLHLPVLYLSGHIVRHKDEYYACLRGVTRDDAWEPWLLFMLEAVRTTALWTLQLVEDVERLRTTSVETIAVAVPTASASELSQLLFSQPYVRIENLVQHGMAQRQTASRWLHALADAGVLARHKVGRSVLFTNVALLNLLLGATDSLHDGDDHDQ